MTDPPVEAEKEEKEERSSLPKEGEASDLEARAAPDKGPVVGPSRGLTWGRSGRRPKDGVVEKDRICRWLKNGWLTSDVRPEWRRRPFGMNCPVQRRLGKGGSLMEFASEWFRGWLSLG